MIMLLRQRLIKANKLRHSKNISSKHKTMKQHGKDGELLLDANYDNLRLLFLQSSVKQFNGDF